MYFRYESRNKTKLFEIIESNKTNRNDENAARSRQIIQPYREEK